MKKLLSLIPLLLTQYADASVSIFLQVEPKDTILYFHERFVNDVRTASTNGVVINLTSGEGCIGSSVVGGSQPYYKNLEQAFIPVVAYAVSALPDTVSNTTAGSNTDYFTQKYQYVNGHQVSYYTYKNVHIYNLRIDECGGLHRLYNYDTKNLKTIDGSTTYRDWTDVVNTVSNIVKREGRGNTAVTFNTPSQTSNNTTMATGNTIYYTLAGELGSQIANANTCLIWKKFKTQQLKNVSQTYSLPPNWGDADTQYRYQIGMMGTYQAELLIRGEPTPYSSDYLNYYGRQSIDNTTVGSSCSF